MKLTVMTPQPVPRDSLRPELRERVLTEGLRAAESKGRTPEAPQPAATPWSSDAPKAAEIVVRRRRQGVGPMTPLAILLRHAREQTETVEASTAGA